MHGQDAAMGYRMQGAGGVQGELEMLRVYKEL